MSSPLRIQMLLHFHCVCEAWRPDSPAARDISAELLSNGLIRELEQDEKDQIDDVGEEGEAWKYVTTDKGTALVRHICALPDPVPVWIMPAVHTHKV